MEGEVGFLIGRPLQGSYITPQEILAATDAMAMVVEIVALSEFGVSLQPGDVVLSGGITPMQPVAAGDVFNIQMTRQPPLTIRFH